MTDPLPYYCAAGDHRTEERMLDATSGQGYITHPDSHHWVYSPREVYDRG